MSSLVAGVVSGLVATLIVFVIRAYWLKVIMPWYENRLYQGPKIEGTWATEIQFPDGITNKHRISIERIGYNVIGTAFCVEGPMEGQIYAFSGTFNNLLLTAYYRVANTRRLERGAFTLMLVEDGSKLQGHLTYYDDRTSSVRSAPCEWRPSTD